ncbi:ATP-dependent Clp protease adapter ClpS [Enteractinococcus fodinae]|uniref:ATP-dependent Clp protease adapter protein ClpS n=1 Tax=Enteractinococcus fodinae TaxID=684663 RepID=A0ABU2B0L0_9MICC|nr:ATP-dependent Clp protease adapter ClpS [Enteractinococcus fodinae]MDR7346816.1 ATP-dependent Clp protease adaptor protein ClpS [Enteractinococcus fodinae]
MSVTSAVDVDPDLAVEELSATTQPWQVIVWNDPVNLMSYVTYVFRTYFGFSSAVAHRLMLQVHNEGKAVVAQGTKEEAERHVAALHGYGLWATYEQNN